MSHRYRRAHAQLLAMILSWFIAALRLSAAETRSKVTTDTAQTSGARLVHARAQ